MNNKWCCHLGKSGLRSNKIIVDDNPTASLITIAKQERANLAVVGPRHHAFDTYLRLTSNKLIEHSPIPDVVVIAKSS